MSCKLFVANFPYSTTDDELNSLFGPHGQVLSVKVATDRETGRSRGFGFVEMGSEQEADNAIRELDGYQIGGRSLAVRVAEERLAGPGGPGAARGGPRPARCRVQIAAARAAVALAAAVSVARVARGTTWVARAAASAGARAAHARARATELSRPAARSPSARRDGSRRRCLAPRAIKPPSGSCRFVDARVASLPT